MPPIFIYSDRTTPRLQYVLDWLFKEQLQLPYTLVSNAADISSGAFVIAYGTVLPGALSIPASGLLWDTGIKEPEISTGEWQNIPTLFHSTGNEQTLPFDIFSAIFFLLSRYEEYYDYTPDKYDRYPATESILYKKGWLRRPLVDEWLHQFRQHLQMQSGVTSAAPIFSFQPSYDIDIAWSYLHKGILRNTGGLAKDILSGRFGLASERIKVLSGNQPDPYDAFGFLQQLHESSNAPTPLFFILASLRDATYDKNIPPSHPAMQALVRQLAAYGRIGMHPSYYSGLRPSDWQSERHMLEQASGQHVHISRQHYIKMRLPDTYRFLQQNAISDDYSVGYGTHLGFRAGTGRSFSWYDIGAEQTSALALHPFCFMDSTARFEEGLSAAAAFDALDEMRKKLKESGSTLTTIFHNFSLGSDSGWNGWAERYEAFFKRIT